MAADPKKRQGGMRSLKAATIYRRYALCEQVEQSAIFWLHVLFNLAFKTHKSKKVIDFVVHRKTLKAK